MDSGIASRGPFNRAYEIHRPLLRNELSGEQEYYCILVQIFFLSQFGAPRLQTLCLGLESSIIYGVRHKENALRASAIMQKVLPRPLAGRQTGIKPWNEASICEGFDNSLRDASRGVQVRVAPHHDFHSRFPTGPNCLPRALVMPTVNQYRVVLPAANDVRDLRSIEPRKSSVPRWVSDISQKGMRIPCKHRDVPIKFDAEAGTRLVFGSCLMTVVDVYIQIGSSGQGP